MTGKAATISAAQAEADTRHWLERAVIGLNLCPFAKAVHVKGQVHYVVHLGDDDDAGLLDALLAEAQALVDRPASERDTTLLMAPHTLADFLDFNDFTARAERRLARAGFEGTLQLASFHPRFQFAGTDPAARRFSCRFLPGGRLSGRLGRSRRGRSCFDRCILASGARRRGRDG